MTPYVDGNATNHMVFMLFNDGEIYSTLIDEFDQNFTNVYRVMKHADKLVNRGEVTMDAYEEVDWYEATRLVLNRCRDIACHNTEPEPRNFVDELRMTTPELHMAVEDLLGIPTIKRKRKMKTKPQFKMVATYDGQDLKHMEDNEILDVITNITARKNELAAMPIDSVKVAKSIKAIDADVASLVKYLDER